MGHMTVGMLATEANVSVLAPGDETGDYDRLAGEPEVMAPGRFALTLSTDEVVLITGTRAELRDWLADVASAINDPALDDSEDDDSEDDD